MIKILIILTAILLSPITFAYEVIDGCATYKNTNKSYKVEIRIFKGDELNEKTKSYNYQSYLHYAVIFWGEGQASVIKLNYYYGSLSAYGTDGTDQAEREWNLRPTQSYCY